MKSGDIVKYSKPQPGEEAFRFVLLDDPTGEVGERVSIQLICDWAIRPVETVAIGEVSAI